MDREIHRIRLWQVARGVTMTTTPPSLPVIDFETVGPAVGTRFPDVRLPDQNGRMVDLHAARAGRRALIVFYRSADW
jgi:hypothetical protein